MSHRRVSSGTLFCAVILSGMFGIVSVWLSFSAFLARRALGREASIALNDDTVTRAELSTVVDGGNRILSQQIEVVALGSAATCVVISLTCGALILVRAVRR